jgi:Putative metal-binding motif
MLPRRRPTFSAVLFALTLSSGCSSRGVPDPFAFDGGAGDGGQPETSASSSGGADVDAGDPTLGGPCLDDAQCDDHLACTTNACDATVGRCRSSPDDAPCQNAAYCDGEERCDNKLGCVAGAPVTCEDGNSCTIDACDEATHLCSHAPRDADHDGDPDAHCGGHDCDDADPTVSAKAPEICGDGKDDDCDGAIDEAACVSPEHDTCSAPLTIDAPGAYALDTTGASFDYATSCGVGGKPGSADVVAALVLPAGPAVDVALTARTAGALVSVAIAAQCGDPTSEFACGASYVSAAGGQVSKVIARAVGDASKSIALPVYVATQPASAVTLDVQILAPAAAPDNETCGSAAPVDLGVPFAASLLGPARDLASACETPLGELVYAFTLPVASDVTAYATSLDGDGVPALSLRGQGCALPADEIACDLAEAARVFRHALPAGDYFLAVSATAPTLAQVTVEASAPTAPSANETCASAPEIPPNKTISVGLGLHQHDIDLGCSPGGADAAYTLDISAASDVLLAMRIAQSDTGGVALARPACGGALDLLACGVGATSPLRASLRGVPKGSYRVVAASANGISVTLTALVRPAVPTTLVPFADACADALVIPADGGFFQGNTANNTADFSAGCDQNSGLPAGAPDQILSLTLPAKKRVVLDMSGSTYATLLDVRQGPACPGVEVPAGCTIGKSGARSYLDLTLEAGTYYLQIDGFYGDVGAWSLDVRVVDP